MKVFLVFCDDDEAQRMAFEDAIEEEVVPELRQKYPSIDVSLQTYDSGDRFINAIQSGQVPQLIVLDINMPGGKSGIDVLRWVVEQPNLKDVPVVMFTTSPTHQRECISLGAADYQTKPNPILYGEKIKAMIERFFINRDVNAKNSWDIFRK